MKIHNLYFSVGQGGYDLNIWKTSQIYGPLLSYIS